MTTGWTLLCVGMLAVFMVLLFVVVSGRLLIQLTNSWVPALSSMTEVPTLIPDHIHSVAQKIVEEETQGKGRVEKIEPLKSSDHG